MSNEYLVMSFQDGLKVVQLFIVIMLTRYLSGSSTISTQLAYVLVAAMTITSFAIAICLNQSFFKQYALGMHLKTTCAAMIFKKVFLSQNLKCYIIIWFCIM